MPHACFETWQNSRTRQLGPRKRSSLDQGTPKHPLRRSAPYCRRLECSHRRNDNRARIDARPVGPHLFGAPVRGSVASPTLRIDGMTIAENSSGYFRIAELTRTPTL